MEAFGVGIEAMLRRIPLPEKEEPALQRALEQSQRAYRDAWQHLLRQEEFQSIGLKIFQVLEREGIEAALQSLSEEEVSALEQEAEALLQQGKAELSGKLFQWLSLFSNDGQPNLYAYVMLAEDLANEDIGAAAKIYDFLINLFPKNPILLLSAAECHRDAQHFERALSLLNEAEQSYLDLGKETESMGETLGEIRELAAAVQKQLVLPAMA
jgi:tetratricopeptide (TPR) repeat protein